MQLVAEEDIPDFKITHVDFENWMMEGTCSGALMQPHTVIKMSDPRIVRLCGAVLIDGVTWSHVWDGHQNQIIIEWRGTMFESMDAICDSPMPEDEDIEAMVRLLADTTERTAT